MTPYLSLAHTALVHGTWAASGQRIRAVTAASSLYRSFGPYVLGTRVRSFASTADGNDRWIDRQSRCQNAIRDPGLRVSLIVYIFPTRRSFA